MILSDTTIGKGPTLTWKTYEPKGVNLLNHWEITLVYCDYNGSTYQLHGLKNGRQAGVARLVSAESDVTYARVGKNKFVLYRKGKAIPYTITGTPKRIKRTDDLEINIVIDTSIVHYQLKNYFKVHNEYLMPAFSMKSF